MKRATDSISEDRFPLEETPESDPEMARQRHVAMRNLRQVDADEVYLSHDDPYIDFSSAGLYLVGLQTTVATVACAAASVASCWLLPVATVSAVRTLALTAAVGFLCMRKPLRVGRVRGVGTIFNALRPCIALYIGSLVIEQLVHTCVAEDHLPSGYTRKVVFHSMIGLMALSGFVRAYRPTSETDAPFLLTSAAVLIVAMLPPPATPLSGPLCEGASLFHAGERLLRAFLFSTLYVIHVYCSPPNRNAIHDLVVCIMRCAAAAVWVLGCHIFVLWLGLIQAFVALWARFGQNNSVAPIPTYGPVDTRSDSGLSDSELGIPPPPVLSSAGGYNYNGYNGYNGGYGGCGGYAGCEKGTRASTPDVASSSFSDGIGVPVDAASLAQLAATHGNHGNGGLSKERMAAIAAGIH